MAKKAKAPTVPKIYEGLSTDTKNLHLCLVKDRQGHWFKFDSPAHCHIVKDGIDTMYESWDHLEQMTLPATNPNWNVIIDALHRDVFKEPVPEKQDRITTLCRAYQKLCSIAEDRTKQGNPINKEGRAGRKSTLATRVYTVLERPKDFKLATPQAVTCMSIMESVMDDKRQVTEAKLKDAIIARATELKTRQDPWRIFQYYRPKLIAAKVIIHN